MHHLLDVNIVQFGWVRPKEYFLGHGGGDERWPHGAFVYSTKHKPPQLHYCRVLATRKDKDKGSDPQPEAARVGARRSIMVGGGERRSSGKGDGPGADLNAELKRRRERRWRAEYELMARV